jgi:hypothetical protein
MNIEKKLNKTFEKLRTTSGIIKIYFMKDKKDMNS